jgi:hypothetical protein
LEDGEHVSTLFFERDGQFRLSVFLVDYRKKKTERFGEFTVHPETFIL